MRLFTITPKSKSCIVPKIEKLKYGTPAYLKTTTTAKKKKNNYFFTQDLLKNEEIKAHNRLKYCRFTAIILTGKNM